MTDRAATFWTAFAGGFVGSFAAFVVWLIIV